MMTATVTADLKKNIKYFFDKAFSGEYVFVARPERKNVVVISEDAFNEYQRLKNNEEYLTKIRISEQQFNNGKFIEKSMEELEAMLHE